MVCSTNTLCTITQSLVAHLPTTPTLLWLSFKTHSSTKLTLPVCQRLLFLFSMFAARGTCCAYMLASLSLCMYLCIPAMAGVTYNQRTDWNGMNGTHSSHYNEPAHRFLPPPASIGVYIETDILPLTNIRPLTCGVDYAVSSDGPVWGLDIPLPITGGCEARDQGWVVDLGSIHTGPSSQGHG